MRTVGEGLSMTISFMRPGRTQGSSLVDVYGFDWGGTVVVPVERGSPIQTGRRGGAEQENLEDRHDSSVVSER